jgi:DNA-binding IclR family transcriptional regulator
MGYLVQEGPHGRYRLGSAVLSLGYPLLEYFPIRRKARPLMQQLAKECGGSVSIGIRDRLNVVYIEVVRTHARRVYPLDVGTSYPILGTAIGRAYLMALDLEARESIMNQVRVKAPAQWERFGRSVQRSIKHYERWQCCTSVGELFADVQAVAVPMGPIDNGEWAALNCSFQGRELNDTWLRTEIAPKLHDIARRILD